MKRAWAFTGVTAILCAFGATASAQVVAGRAAAGQGAVAVTDVHYVAVHEAGSTVFFLSIAVGEASRGEFDVVIPVPPKPAARALAEDRAPLFSRLDALAAPRLVEYWEQDPCEFHTGGPDDGVAERDVGSDVPLPTPPVAPNPTVVLVDKLADAVAAIEGRGRALPAGAGPILEEYAAAGMSFVVATAGKGAQAVNLQWRVSGSALSVPTRLLAAHAEKPPRVVIDVLAAHRFEAENRNNLAAPANTDVKWGVKGSTDAFHDAVLSRLFAAAPAAVITEYAWRATSCAPCPGPPLDDKSLVQLGVAAQGQHEVMIFTDGKIAAKPDGPPSLRTALMSCYGKALAAGEAVAGEVKVAVKLDGGKVSSATIEGDDANEQLSSCAKTSVEATSFDGTGESGTVRVEFLPLSRQFVSSMVLSRLRLRVTGAEEDDLRLRAGTPIAGGAEVGARGAPDKGAVAAPKANHFQSRYTVRHRWAGAKPACLDPKTGVWGGPPKGVTPQPAGKKLVAPAEGDVDALLEGDLANVEALTMRFPPNSDAPAPTQEPPSPEPLVAPAPSVSPDENPANPVATPAHPANPAHRWVGYFAIAVCILALWQAMRQR